MNLLSWRGVERDSQSVNETVLYQETEASTSHCYNNNGYHRILVTVLLFIRKKTGHSHSSSSKDKLQSQLFGDDRLVPKKLQIFEHDGS